MLPDFSLSQLMGSALPDHLAVLGAIGAISAGSAQNLKALIILLPTPSPPPKKKEFCCMWRESNKSQTEGFLCKRKSCLALHNHLPHRSATNFRA